MSLWNLTSSSLKLWHSIWCKTSRLCSSFKKELHTWHRIGHYLIAFLSGSLFFSLTPVTTACPPSQVSLQIGDGDAFKKNKNLASFSPPLGSLLDTHPLQRGQGEKQPSHARGRSKWAPAFPPGQMCTAERTTAVPTTCWLHINAPGVYSKINVIQISSALPSKNSQEEELLPLPTHEPKHAKESK